MNMKAVVVKEIGSFEITWLPIPRPGPGEVLIKVEVTGLCRTDLKIVRAGHRDLVLPRVPGEEVVGRIVDRGPEVRGFENGDLVYVYPGVWCGACERCRSCAENLCPDMRIMGFHRDGGFAEYLVAPAQSLIQAPQGLSADEAVLAEPLSCCINALELGGVAPGKRVGVWGAGPAGTLLSRASSAFGAEPFSIEPDARRRALIGGLELPPEEGFDLAVVAVGDREAYLQALGSLKPRGRLVVFSGLAPGFDTVDLNFNALHYLEQSLVGAYGCGFGHGQKALDLIASGRVPVRDMISHRLSLWDLGRALDLVADKAGMKILLYPD